MLTRLYQNIRVIAADLEWVEDLQMHLALEEHIQTACLPPAPTETRRWRQTGENTETRRVKPGNTRLHSAEDSWDEVNFNSAAVATYKNLLINRDECGVSASSTPLPLD